MSPAAPKVEGIAYLVCATQRSGSTLLCELLKGTEVAGVPEEFFETLRASGLPRQPREYFRDERLADVVAGLPPLQFGSPEKAGEFEGWFTYAVQRGTSTNGVFGAKMMWNYFDDFRERIAELPGLGALNFTDALDVVFPKLEIVFVRRRDKVAQAVSLWKAIQTQHWRNEVEATAGDGTVAYDYRALKYLVDELHRWDARWEDWFHATGREPIRVIYEEFVDSRAATVGRVLDALGIDPREPGERGPMRRQADDLSADWVARYRADDLSDGLPA
ncbi:MAG TPA: Stf0 family sulfotransferase [Acidimicrobiia bacterium]|jgi:LPS sulfotransferase NodH